MLVMMRRGRGCESGRRGRGRGRERERERERERDDVGKRVKCECVYNWQKSPTIKAKDPYYKSKRTPSEHTLNPATHTHTHLNPTTHTSFPSSPLPLYITPPPPSPSLAADGQAVAHVYQRNNVLPPWVWELLDLVRAGSQHMEARRYERERERERAV